VKPCIRAAAFLAFTFTASAFLSAEEPLFAARALVGTTANSPDGKSAVSLQNLDSDADDFPTQVTVRTAQSTLTGRINFGLNAEVLWSPDSRAFTITGSSEGAMGQYHTNVFIVGKNRLITIPLTQLIEAAFGHPVKCGWSEVPNVAAVKWLNGSSTLLLAAQIIPHSNCDSFGTFKGFVVDLRTKRVVRGFDQLKVKRLYGSDLAKELSSADDKCIRTPQSCFVSTNHPELRR
jgi:hypothetical protein